MVAELVVVAGVVDWFLEPAYLVVMLWIHSQLAYLKSSLSWAMVQSASLSL